MHKSNRHRFIISIAILLILYLGSRLYALESLPVFIDEALHIWRARAIQGGDIAVGLIEGKWLSMALMSLSLRLPHTALWATRFTSVTAGALTIVAIALIGKELFRIRIGLLAAVIYLLMPYSFFYNRLALTDGIAAAFGAWICYFSIKTIRLQGGFYSFYIVALATLLIFAPLIKFTNFLFVLVPLATIIFLLPRSEWRAGLARVGPSLLAFLIILITLYSVGTAIHFAGERSNAGGSFFSIKEVVLPNISVVANWYWLLLTPPLATLAAISAMWALVSRSGRALYLLTLFLSSVVPYILFIKVWYPRYLAFSLVPLALLAAQFLVYCEKKISSSDRLTRRVHVAAVLTVGVLFTVGVLLIWPFLYNVRLVHKPESLPLPELISWQFIRGWPSGYGSEELSEFLVTQAEETSAELHVLRTPYWSQTKIGGLEVHLPTDPAFEVMDIGQDVPEELAVNAQRLEDGGRILFIIDATHRESVALLESIRPRLEATRIWHYPKPAAADGLEVWEVRQILTSNN